MDETRIIINHGGIWYENTYKGSWSDMVLVLSNMNYEFLVFLMHKIVRINPNYFFYDIRSLHNTHGKIVRFKIESDRDLRFVLKVGNDVYKVYVTVEFHPSESII